MNHPVSKTLVSLLQQFRKDRQGSIYIIFAAALVVIIGALALGITFNRTVKLESDYQSVIRKATRIAGLEFIRWRIDQNYNVAAPARSRNILSPVQANEAQALTQLRNYVIQTIQSNTPYTYGAGVAADDTEFCVSPPRLVQPDPDRELLQFAIGFPQSSDFLINSSSVAFCDCSGAVPTGDRCQSVVSERLVRSNNDERVVQIAFALEASSQIRQLQGAGNGPLDILNDVGNYLRSDWDTDINQMPAGGNIFGQKLVCANGDCGCTPNGNDNRYGTSGCVSDVNSSIPTGGTAATAGLVDQFRTFPMTMRVSMQRGRQCPEAQYTFSVEEIIDVPNQYCTDASGNPRYFRRVHWYHSCASVQTIDYASAQNCNTASTTHNIIHPRAERYMRWTARYVGPTPGGNPTLYNLSYQGRYINNTNLYGRSLIRRNSDYGRPADFTGMHSANTDRAMAMECTTPRPGEPLFSETEGGLEYPGVVSYRNAAGTGGVGGTNGTMRCIPPPYDHDTCTPTVGFGSDYTGIFVFEPMGCNPDTGAGCCFDGSGNLNSLNPNCTMPIGYYEVVAQVEDSPDLAWDPVMADRLALAGLVTNGLVEARFEGGSPDPRWPGDMIPAPGAPNDTYSSASTVRNRPDIHSNICSNCVAGAACPVEPLNALGDPMNDLYTEVVVHDDKPIPPLQWHIGMVTVEGHRWRHTPDRIALDHFDNMANNNPQRQLGGRHHRFNVHRSNLITRTWNIGDSYNDNQLCNGLGCETGYRVVSEVPSNDGTLNIHRGMRTGNSWPEIPIGTIQYAENSPLLIAGNRAPLDFKVTGLSCPEGQDSAPLSPCQIGTGGGQGIPCIEALLTSYSAPYATPTGGMSYTPGTGMRVFSEGGHEPLASCQAIGCTVNALIDSVTNTAQANNTPLLIPIVSCPTTQCGDNAGSATTSRFNQAAGAAIPTRWSGHGNHAGGTPGAHAGHRITSVNCQTDAGNSISNTVECWNNQSARLVARSGKVFPILYCANSTDTLALLADLEYVDSDPAFGIADEYGILGQDTATDNLSRANLAYTLLISARPDLGRELNQGVAY